jgi:hexosaminidase
MRVIAFCFLSGLLAATLHSCKQPETTDTIMTEHIIPKPLSISYGTEPFQLSAETQIHLGSDSPAVGKVAEFLAGLLRPSTGFKLPVNRINTDSLGSIRLSLGADSSLGDEGYELTVNRRMVHVKAYKPAGLFMGVQTLRQMLPHEIESDSTQTRTWEIAPLTIRDKPEFAYRGAMLDVARHFFGVDDVKRYIDLISLYKMNALHLHLSDDQGWRIEIKSWPKLTEEGGKSQVGGGKGGFYTQEQYKDIVRYAADRFVTIVPEIDMPGHTNAALVSYPELNCRDTTITPHTGTEVGFSTLCTGNEKTYRFVEDVLRELAEMTPGPYLHIGGDESHVTPLNDYIRFMNRVQPMVAKYGKTVIGWDELAKADLLPNSVVQFWADSDNSLLAVSKGAKVIMSPAKKVYLDMQYDSTTRLGLHWAAYIEVDSAYDWDPSSYVPGIFTQNILGVEAPLWTETIQTMDDIEYMAFPRLPGIAEIGWTPSSARKWDEYKYRLAVHARRFRALGIDFYPSAKVKWKD